MVLFSGDYWGGDMCDYHGVRIKIYAYWYWSFKLTPYIDPHVLPHFVKQRKICCTAQMPFWNILFPSSKAKSWAWAVHSSKYFKERLWVKLGCTSIYLQRPVAAFSHAHLNRVNCAWRNEKKSIFADYFLRWNDFSFFLLKMRQAGLKKKKEAIYRGSFIFLRCCL